MLLLIRCLPLVPLLDHCFVMLYLVSFLVLQLLEKRDLNCLPDFFSDCLCSVFLSHDAMVSLKCVLLLFSDHTRRLVDPLGQI